VEVKAAETVNESDLRGLRKLRGAAGKRFVTGVVLYDGNATIRFRDGLFAVPVRKLWETT
jgi:predicted AAA+ superfamily ATPase